nr:unnamed protein product [Callosobruchus chinensis]
MRCFDTLNKYCKLVKESPVAKKRNVIAKRSCTGIAFRNFVSIFDILGPTRIISLSKSSAVMCVKFFKWPLSMSLSKALFSRLANRRLIHIFFVLFFFLFEARKRIGKKAPAATITSSILQICRNTES